MNDPTSQDAAPKPPKKKRGPLRRIKGKNIDLIRKALTEVALEEIILEESMRQSIRRNMPFIYFLRTKHGYVFRRIVPILASVGIIVAIDTLREYYSTFLPGNEERYKQYFLRYSNAIEDFCFALQPEKEQSWF